MLHRLGEANVTDYYTAEENIVSASVPAYAMQWRMNSPGHRGNILNNNFTHVGVACVKNGDSYIWVQMFIGVYHTPSSSGNSGGSQANNGSRPEASSGSGSTSDTGAARPNTSTGTPQSGSNTEANCFAAK